VATLPFPQNKLVARMALVEQHVGFENQHDLDGVIDTFGATAEYQDSPWAEQYHGRDEVRRFYTQLMKALPDLSIEIVRRHVAEETIVLEVMIRGTHRGTWRGLLPTGRKLELPLCGVYTFDGDDRLAGERIYYDRGTVLRQLGVFHEPDSFLGRIMTAVSHPITITKSLIRTVLGSSGK